jgi:hypothetical protein
MSGALQVALPHAIAPVPLVPALLPLLLRLPLLDVPSPTGLAQDAVATH